MPPWPPLCPLLVPVLGADPSLLLLVEEIYALWLLTVEVDPAPFE